MLIRFIFPKPNIMNGPPVAADLPRQSLTLIQLAALPPPEFDVEIVDGRVSEIPYDTKADFILRKHVSFKPTAVNSRTRCSKQKQGYSPKMRGIQL